MPELHDNTARHRYEMPLDCGTAFVLYEAQPDRLILLHAEVPRAARGRSFGAKLVRAVLDDVRRRGLRVVPVCGYIRAFIRRHPEYADLLAA
jgi:predicted GNAT family acetyltransferase